MADQREYGYNTHLLLERESSFGGGGSSNFNSVVFDACNLSADRDLVKSSRAGAGRDPTEIFQDAVVCAGDATVPLEMRDIGLWLTGLLGDPSTSGSSTYTHTFTSGGADLPSFEIEKGFPNVPKYENFLGCMINSLTINPQRSGPMTAVFGIMGQNMTPNTSSQGGTPTTNTLARASGLQGTIKADDTLLANINTFDFTYSNNLQGIETLNQTDGQVEGIDPDEASCNGNLNVRFYDDDLYDAATGKTAVDLELAYTISASLKVTFNIHEVYLRQTSPPIEGPGGINVGFSFEALKNTSAGEMFEAILINDLAGTFYTS